MEYGKRLERLKEKSKFFLENRIKVFIKDFYENYYFAEIKEIKELHLLFYNFEGNRKGEVSEISWIDIKDIQEYKEREDLE